MTETNPYETPGNLISASKSAEDASGPILVITLGYTMLYNRTRELGYIILLSDGLSLTYNTVMGDLGVLWRAT